MKNFFKWALCLAVALTAGAMTACGDDEDPNPGPVTETELTVSPEALNNLAAAGETKTLTVKSNAAWTATVENALARAVTMST